MKKTILHVTETTSGGVLPVIVGLCNGLCNKYKVILAYGIREDTPNDFCENFDKQVLLIKLDTFHKKINILEDVKTLVTLKTIIKKYNPDIIHFHSGKAGLLGRIGLLWQRTEKYYTPHGYSFLNSQNGKVYNSIMYFAEYVLSNMNCFTIACGSKEFYFAKKMNKISYLVNNGVDINKIQNIERNMHKISQKNKQKDRQKFTVYTSGRIWNQKNPKLFNKVAMMCQEVSFLWIGDSEDEEKSILTSPNITITGFVTNSEAIEYALNCNCYISCSLGEGLPISLLEAMCMRKLCIVSDVPGNNDLIVDGKNGFIAHTADDYARIIRNCCEGYDTNQYTSMSYDLVCKEYSIDGMCRKYEEIYKKKNR